jgi:hypothetical protein
MDVEPPTVLYTDLDTPNGYALGGPDGGVVVLDVALLSTLEDDGLEALLAHELAHLERGDGLVRMLVDAGLRTAVGVATVASSPGILLLAGVAKASGWLRGDPAAWSRSRAWRLRAAVIAVVTMVPCGVCRPPPGSVPAGRVRRRPAGGGGHRGPGGAGGSAPDGRRGDRRGPPPAGAPPGRRGVRAGGPLPPAVDAPEPRGAGRPPPPPGRLTDPSPDPTERLLRLRGSRGKAVLL